MGNLIAYTPKGKSKKRNYIKQKDVESDDWKDVNGNPINSEHLLISLLLPPSVKEFMRQVEDEVTMLCGGRYSRSGKCSRWGRQDGSIYLGGHKVGIERPRVRSNGAEHPLKFYEQFQSPELFDKDVFTSGLKHVSQRDYAKGIRAIQGSFGFGKSKVSKSWIKSTKANLTEMMERELGPLDIISVFIDGKRFRNYGVVVALGVSSDGRKHVIGLFQAETENSTSCIELLNDLERRGLPTSGLLFVVDGGSGINKALEIKYLVNDEKKRAAVRLRCHFHKLNNLVDILGRNHEKMPEILSIFSAMKNAKDSVEARAHSRTLEGILKRANQSALKSFLEAKSDLMTLHELGLNADLKRFFSTTNPIENVNSLTEEDLRRVKRWRDSEHFQRWFAASALNAERKMRKVRGFKELPKLKSKLCELTKKCVDEKRIAA